MQLNNMVQHRVWDFRIVPALKPMYQRRLLPFVLSKAAFDFPNCLIATVKCEKRLWWTHYKRINHKLKVACWRFKWLNLQVHYELHVIYSWFTIATIATATRFFHPKLIAQQSGRSHDRGQRFVLADHRHGWTKSIAGVVLPLNVNGLWCWKKSKTHIVI